MSNVIIDKNKIDILANAISVKSGEPLTLTLDEMVEAVDGIETGGVTPTLETVTKTYTPSTSAVTDTITPSSGYDGIEEVDVTVSAVPLADYLVLYGGGYVTENNSRKFKAHGVLQVESAGWIDDGDKSGSYTTYSAIPTGTTITPTESAQTIGGANYMMEGAVTVNAIPSNYVGSGITQRSSSDLTASGATVTAPAGYYASSASKSVASGTEGTPTAAKGTVSNHAISVTPSVTNSAGYISGGTHNGTAVSVSASELVSGTLSITQNGTADVTNYASVDVSVSGGGGSMNAQSHQSTSRSTSTTATSLNSLTCSTTGTYTVTWTCTRSSTSGTWSSQLYVGGTASGSSQTTWSNHVQTVSLTNVSISANQTVAVYGVSRGSNYYIYAPQLTIVQTS